MNDEDHRAIGNRLDLFHQQEEGPGVIFWHPRGAALWGVLEAYIRRRMKRAGFEEVRTPQLLARSLWEKSGHWEKFAANMFVAEDGERAFALKPMSCPGHVQIFNKRVRSHRDLPLRYSELGACHRNEPSGALHGLMRVRAFVQDDAHVFCRPDQVVGEVASFCALLSEIYRDFGFEDFDVAFSTRPEMRSGSDEIWDEAEALLEAAARSAGLDYRIQPGDGAFYGPKLEFILKDRFGRSWQCGTVQLDFVLPERLDAGYVDELNRRVRPVMIHHAVFGSMERFIAILLEHHRGQLPFWLAPDQVVVAPVSNAQTPFAIEVATSLREADLRAVVDDSPERLSRRIVEARERGVPVFVTVGEREVRDRSLSIRQGKVVEEGVQLDEAVRRLVAANGPSLQGQM